MNGLLMVQKFRTKKFRLKKMKFRLKKMKFRLIKKMKFRLKKMNNKRTTSKQPTRQSTNFVPKKKKKRNRNCRRVRARARRSIKRPSDPNQKNRSRVHTREMVSFFRSIFQFFLSRRLRRARSRSFLRFLF